MQVLEVVVRIIDENDLNKVKNNNKYYNHSRNKKNRNRNRREVDDIQGSHRFIWIQNITSNIKN